MKRLKKTWQGSRLMPLLAASVFALLASGAASAQELRPSSSMYLAPADKADVTLPFSISAEGKRYTPDWGLDLAWMNEQNLRRGVNHMGKKNVTIGRSSYRVRTALKNDTELAADQIDGLRERAQLFDRCVGTTLPLMLNCDNGFDPDGDSKNGSNIGEYYTTGGRANVAHWAAMLDASVAWMQANTRHPIVGVSVMNEPDFKGNDKELIQGTAADIRDIARTLKSDYERFMEIPIVGCNTLNNDQAMPWYNTAKDYLDWGNTHQLAGSFNNYAGFHEQLARDGKLGVNDEMHNVAEAFIGLEYGMTKGIWWAFDSRARGEFCQISREGSRLAYAEHRSNWTAATVYRNDETGKVKAFIGGSERQAATTTYQLLSTDRPVYYDGQGPLRELRMELPGGTGYQKGQTNAERVIDVLWGDDVPPAPIDGQYIIMSRGNRCVVAQGGTTDGHTGIQLENYDGKASQQWSITPVSNRVGGDFSFHHILSLADGNRINVVNHSTLSPANLISYNASGDINEQWYLEYAGDGYYYIRNRESALYLTAEKRSSMAGAKLVQNELLSGINMRDRQLWRILPTDAVCETNAPAKPQGLTAKAEVAAVRLSWAANAEADLEGYMVLRADKDADNWNTIARKLKTCWFVDNTCLQGHEYIYKVKAIDHSDNQSECSDEVLATPTGEPAMIARWHMDDNLLDETANMMDAAAYGQTGYTSTVHKSGEKALRLSGSNYVQLPYEVASTGELTVALWVNWTRSSGDTWQRIFDFGNGTSHYMFLTPDCGTGMRFAMKNGGDEQQVDCPARLASGTWKHVAVSIGQQKVAIFVDGEEVASSTAIGISPADIRPVLNYLGRSQFSADAYFKGYVDDVRIYNYALSAQEVQQVMGDLTNGIMQTKSEDNPASQVVYGIDGRLRQQVKRGINIVDGKKILTR